MKSKKNVFGGFNGSFETHTRNSGVVDEEWNKKGLSC